MHTFVPRVCMHWLHALTMASPTTQVAAAYGCRCFIALPDDAAIEKSLILRALGEIYGICLVSWRLEVVGGRRVLVGC